MAIVLDHTIVPARDKVASAQFFEHHHYAFKISEAEFDAIFARVKDEGIAYGSGPRSRTDMEINHRRGGRGVYFEDPNGHVLEILTA
jgi:catechol 2,3-dioxygenase-like lactoylglutathione lyase family enzyme